MTARASILANPHQSCDDTAYLGHVANDGASCTGPVLHAILAFNLAHRRLICT